MKRLRRLNYIVLSVFCLRQEAKAVSRASVRTVLRAAAVASFEMRPTAHSDC